MHVERECDGCRDNSATKVVVEEAVSGPDMICAFVCDDSGCLNDIMHDAKMDANDASKVMVKAFDDVAWSAPWSARRRTWAG